jgi:hypothetical protein
MSDRGSAVLTGHNGGGWAGLPHPPRHVADLVRRGSRSLASLDGENSHYREHAPETSCIMEPTLRTRSGEERFID